TGVRLRRAAFEKSRRSAGLDGGSVSPGAGEPRPVRMAGTSPLRVADPYCVQRDCRSLETRRARARESQSWRTHLQGYSSRRDRAARQAVPLGGNVADRSAPRNRDAFRTGEKHQRNRQRTWANRRRDKTIAISRAGEFAVAVRGFNAQEYGK